jgi:IS30 family transposase
LDKHDRNEIKILLDKKYSLRDIARTLNRPVSTISREVSRNRVKGEYDPNKAQHKAYIRRYQASFKSKKIVDHPKLRAFVEDCLLDGQSPQAISGRLRYREKKLPFVSKNTIYEFLRSPYGKLIGLKLAKQKKPAKRRGRIKKLSDRVFVNKRPKIIENRGQVGDVEADFIVSGKTGRGILLTVTCRKYRISFLELITDVSIDQVHQSFLKIKQRFPEIKTITLDNDILFKMHKTLEKLLDVKIYFCHPYHSWEKGSVENLNKFIRRYIPKGSNLSRYSENYISWLEKKSNERFMACLNYATPEEKLSSYRQRKMAIKKQQLNADENESVALDPGE